MTSILQITFRMLGLIAALLVWTAVTPANATPFICDATQASSNSLPVLSDGCPVGKGLWGKQLPPKDAHSFWIQCGVFGKPLSLAEAKPIYDVISTDVWMKPEKSHYRCLVGPYDSYPIARVELQKVQKIAKYKQSFIRTFGASEAQQTASAPVPKAKPTPKTAAPKTVTPPAVPKKMSPPPAAAPVMAAAPKPQPQVPVPASTSASQIEIRKSAKLDGFEFVIPFIESKSVLFYMENDKPWNRMSYDEASKTCASLNMKLATVPQWKKFLNSGLMQKENWPIYLPYWGQGSVGLFTSGKTSQLKGTSLLNVMCVRL